MHIDGKLYIKEDTAYGLFLEINVYGDSACDELVMNALKQQNGSYASTVSWDADSSCYHLEAEWSPDPNWGDDYMAVQHRLSSVVPPENISIYLERPHEPVYVQMAFIDVMND